MRPGVAKIDPSPVSLFADGAVLDHRTQEAHHFARVRGTVTRRGRRLRVAFGENLWQPA